MVGLAQMKIHAVPLKIAYLTMMVDGCWWKLPREGFVVTGRLK